MTIASYFLAGVLMSMSRLAWLICDLFWVPINTMEILMYSRFVFQTSSNALLLLHHSDLTVILPFSSCRPSLCILYWTRNCHLSVQAIWAKLFLSSHYFILYSYGKSYAPFISIYLNHLHYLFPIYFTFIMNSV